MRIGRKLLACLLACAALSGGSRAEERNEALPTDTARLLARQLPRWHLSRRPLNDEIACVAWERYVSALDFDRTYFLASDVEQFRAACTNLDDQLKIGDISFAYEVYDLARARVSNRVAFVESLLKEGLDLNGTNTYLWKRKDAPWPADEQEWDDLWRRKVTHLYIAHVVNRELGQATNAPTEALEESEETAPADVRLTPEEAILKSQRQLLDALNDNRSEWPVERYFSAFARAYDPHSDYLSANQSEDFEIGMKLSLVGIGARLSSEDGAAKVEEIIPGGPADRDGRLKAGDKIIAVAQGDGEPVSILHWPLSRAVRLIRGEKNTKVVLTVIPASDPTGTKTVQIDLIRDEVKLEDQAAKSEVRVVKTGKDRECTLGVVKLPGFYFDLEAARNGNAEARSSTRDVRDLILNLKTNGIEGLVLDLRGNGGGLLAEAVRMTGLFIETGPVVQVSDGAQRQIMGDPDPFVAFDGPMVVLVDRNTASASEILAGALQDYGRAVIVGDSKTQGKGTVQTLADLRADQPAHGKLKVTTASFYRITGASTQLRGVTTDIVVPSPLDALEIGEETLPQALPWTQIQPLDGWKEYRLKEFIPDLRRRVEERQARDERYQTYLDLVRRLSARQLEPTASLNLQERLAQAREEKALSDKLTQKEKKSDIVLEEALQILCDLISLMEEARQADDAHS